MEDVLRFEREFLDHLRRNTSILNVLRDTNVLDKDTEAQLGVEVEKFTLEFQGSSGAPLNEVFEADVPEDINQEKIVKSKR